MQAHLLFRFPHFFIFIIIFHFASGLISYPSLCLPFVHKSPHLTEKDAKAKANTSASHTTNLSHTWDQNTGKLKNLHLFLSQNIQPRQNIKNLLVWEFRPGP